MPPGPGEYDEASVSKISLLRFNQIELIERVLIAAYRSPVPASLAFSLKKYEKSIPFFVGPVK